VSLRPDAPSNRFAVSDTLSAYLHRPTSVDGVSRTDPFRKASAGWLKCPATRGTPERRGSARSDTLCRQPRWRPREKPRYRPVVRQNITSWGATPLLPTDGPNYLVTVADTVVQVSFRTDPPSTLFFLKSRKRLFDCSEFFLGELSNRSVLIL